MTKQNKFFSEMISGKELDYSVLDLVQLTKKIETFFESEEFKESLNDSTRTNKRIREDRR